MASQNFLKFVPVMAYRLFDATPSSQTMLTHLLSIRPTGTSVKSKANHDMYNYIARESIPNYEMDSVTLP